MRSRRRSSGRNCAACRRVAFLECWGECIATSVSRAPTLWPRSGSIPISCGKNGLSPIRLWRTKRRSPNVIEPADLAARQRFARELDRNCSVIASAGSGKTRAITDRIVEIARSSHALERLPQLVVVTYTNRAADEMQQRTRQHILEGGLSLEVIEAFNRAFFGTIHSFCVKLLAAHGHHLGLPADLELITDDEE